METRMPINMLFVIVGKLGTWHLPAYAVEQCKLRVQLSGGWALERGHLSTWDEHVEING